MTQPVSSQSEWQTVCYKKKFGQSELRPPEEKKGDFASLAPKEIQISRSRPFKIVRNAHQDDIHCCLRLENQFVTGSKDGGLRMWSLDGKLIKNVYTPKKINYQSWITSLAIVSNSWFSGTRDGYLDRWSFDGEHIGNLATPDQDGGGQAKCKERNVHRISSIAQLPTEENTYLIGRRTAFFTHRIGTKAILGSCKTSKYDWVYCLYPLNFVDVLTVTGSRLDLYSRTDETFMKWQETSLIKEQINESDENNQIRPFISHVIPLTGRKNQFGISIFDGSIKIYDLSVKKLIKAEKEHKHRVWMIENMAESIFASCADDGLIKLWDVRQSGSVATLQDNLKEKARVSVLLKTQEHTLMSGSCPDQLVNDGDRARLSFWDIRKI